MGPYGTDSQIDYQEIRANVSAILSQNEAWVRPNIQSLVSAQHLQRLNQMDQVGAIGSGLNNLIDPTRIVNVTQDGEARAAMAAMSKEKQEKLWLDEVGETGIPPSTAIRMFMAGDGTLEFWAGTTIATLKDNVLRVKKSKGKHLLSRFKKLARKEGWELAVLSPNVDHTGEVMDLLFLSVTDIPEMDDSRLVSTVKVNEPVPQRHMGTTIRWSLEETPF